MTEMNKKRIKWACRRGMLELDLMIGQFFADCYDDLSPSDQQNFVHLLECGDQDLFDWLTDKRQSADPVLQAMVTKIRQHAKSAS